MLRKALLSLTRPVSNKLSSLRLFSSTIATRSDAEEKKKVGSGIWMVQLVEAVPDYKRPCAFVSELFFPTKESAEAYKKRLIEEQLKIINEDRDEEDLFTEEAFFNGVYSEHKYGDSYMNMPAYDISIREVELEDPTKVADLPSLNRLSKYLDKE